MDEKAFKQVCISVGMGERLIDSMDKYDVPMDEWIMYLAENPHAQEYLHLMQGLAIDIVLDRIGYMLEHELDLARVKALKDFWLVMAEKHAPEKYGKKQKIEIGVRHEEVLEQIEMLEAEVIDMVMEGDEYVKTVD